MLKVMAVRITETNYPLAAALLDSNFLCIPKDRVLGGYVVINEIGPRLRVRGPMRRGYTPLQPMVEDRPATRSISFSNSWYTKNEFFECYKYVDDSLTGSDTARAFYDVERINDVFEDDSED